MVLGRALLAARKHPVGQSPVQRDRPVPTVPGTGLLPLLRRRAARRPHPCRVAGVRAGRLRSRLDGPAKGWTFKD